MLQSDKYSVIETLRDGHRLKIRALTSEDRSDLIAAVARTSAESLAVASLSRNAGSRIRKRPSF
jgi:hypothetical protein